MDNRANKQINGLKRKKGKKTVKLEGRRKQQLIQNRAKQNRMLNQYLEAVGAKKPQSEYTKILWNRIRQRNSEK